MATTEVLLLEPIHSLGHEGEQVKVKAGYARNYLLPRKLAIPITKANRKQMEALAERRKQRLAKEMEAAQATAQKLEQLELKVPVKTGPDGKLFGSVSGAELHRRLEELGVVLNRRQISLELVKAIGQHTAAIKLHTNLTVDFPFEVVSENEESSTDGTTEDS